MSRYIILLRFIHIFSAIFWVGTTLFMVGFLEPTIQSLGAEGGKIMQRLLTNTRFSLFISLAGLLTVFSGLLMYWTYTGFDAAMMFSARLPLTLGATCGILAAIVGAGMQGRASGQLSALGQQIATQNSPPTSEQLSQVGTLQATVRRGSHLSAVLMVLAVIGMVI